MFGDHKDRIDTKSITAFYLLLSEIGWLAIAPIIFLTGQSAVMMTPRSLVIMTFMVLSYPTEMMIAVGVSPNFI